MRHLSILLALVLTTVPAVAQTDAETYVQQASEAFGTPVGDIVGPTGSIEAMAAALLALPAGTNAVVLNQTGTGNAIVAEQTGIDNRAVLSQTGSRNRTSLFQDGSNNLFTATIFGDGNTITTQQVGDGNVYGLIMAGTNPEHVVSQIGNGNAATQFVAPGLQPAGIEQQGNGLQVIVERY